MSPIAIAITELKAQKELGTAERVEQELLVVERENAVKVRMEDYQLESDPEFEKEEIKKLDKNESGDLPRVNENEGAEEDKSSDESVTSLPSPKYVSVSGYWSFPLLSQRCLQKPVLVIKVNWS